MAAPDAQVEYVGFWPRVGAAAIDTALMLLVTVPLLVSIYGWGYFLESGRPLIAGPADVLISWVLPLTVTVIFWRRKEATPGKMAIGARVVDEATGAPLSGGKAVLRYFAYLVSTLPFLAGFLWILWDPRRRAWHDLIAGSVVVRAKRAGA